jgi:hypothetical protein
MGSKHQFLFVLALCLVGLCINVMRNPVFSFLSMQSRSLAGAQLSPHRRRKIILLGPHDRFNFGDLLFEKIVSKLLMTRKNYAESDLIRAGLLNVNMSRFGGHESIISIKRARDLSRQDGGYHIIYLGGESMGCSFEHGLDMLPNNASRTDAKLHQVSNCAYLFPKEELVSANTTTPVVAVANSVGGKYNVATVPRDCRLAVETADHVAFRDLAWNATHRHVAHAQPRPDSAILTSLLFHDTIAQYGNMGQVRHVRNGTGYLAIQFKETDLYWNRAGMIAKVLDGIYNMTNLTTVFFQAGSVPHHDSLALYQKVSHQMTTPFFIFTTTHVWSVVALIRYSSAIISTSLHVRIMAFVHARPRVTICTPFKKHASFIRLWESKDATKCVESLWNASAVTSAVEKSMAILPNATYDAQQRAIDLYLDGFEEWSSLFDKADWVS